VPVFTAPAGGKTVSREKYLSKHTWKTASSSGDLASAAARAYFRVSRSSYPAKETASRASRVSDREIRTPLFRRREMNPRSVSSGPLPGPQGGR